MSEPKFIIYKQQRTNGRNLPTSIIQKVRNVLLQGGLMLLPSDTCYSLATIAMDEDGRNKVNLVLGRGDDPVSIAFSTYRHVRQFMEMNAAVAALIEEFTPGPITIVCKARKEISDELLERKIGSFDRTIGVRIPDSRIERDIAGCTEHLLMTVAVRDPDTGMAIQKFEKACEIVKFGIADPEKFIWGAIEGNQFYGEHSTVVRMQGVNSVELLRQGDIPFKDIQETINNPSGWVVEMERERGIGEH